MVLQDGRKGPVAPRRTWRLRHLLAGLIGALSVTWGLPRARAAWRLHDTAVLFADYGLCMAGPTGAVELRDQPNEFWRLVRRRLVASAPGERVFANCAHLAQQLTANSQVSQLHQATAHEFAEWGGKMAALHLEQLRQGLPDLSVLSQSAWPFLRSGVAVLVKPSLGAKEAMHPVQSPRPAAIQGLQIYGRTLRSRRVSERGWYVVTSDGRTTRAVRSRDRGRHWTATSPWQSALEGTNDRCGSDGSARAFGLEGHRAGVSPSVTYYDHESRSGQSTLGDSNSQVVSFACDETAAVAVTRSESREWSLWLCVSDEACKALPPPPIFSELPADGLDVARLRGATVLAVSQGHVVRVVSTRDDGRSYTPLTVALDHDDSALPDAETYWPAQLLSIAGNLILTQERRVGDGIAVALVSSDYGASWRPFGDSVSK